MHAAMIASQIVNAVEQGFCCWCVNQIAYQCISFIKKWLPLQTLAASGEFYLVDALLKHNVDINAVDKDGLTAIHKAIIGKKQAVTNYLLRESVNPFVCDDVI
ncbi:hypothetical protein Pint_28587 [Pistacia integerrima]|uniref:Uncharacterized protein n=1 Tax=Pistacia integerrima TaxID=434235 RepID=A0ACC0YMN0_9ROSI|nr:hypothetical protein Pint_28587 [Pistacia integerrima]